MKGLKTRLLAAVAVGAAALLPASAHAARNWVLPSTTTLSGSNAWVTVDAASSDDLYFPDLRPLRMDSITVLDSDGQPVQPQNPSTGKFRSTFDVQLTKPGTYRITSLATTILASYAEGGEVKRFRGTVARSETFVTRDKPTTAALATTGQGLEMTPVTHPSDVVAAEPATFKLLLDGKPAAGLEVTLKRGYDHWDPKPSPEIVVKTGADGVFKVTLPQAGLWWISASYRTGETGRGGMGGPPPGGMPAMPGMGGPPGPVQPLAGDGYSASYTAVIEAQQP